MEDIAAAAGITRLIVYRHFARKRACCLSRVPEWPAPGGGIGDDTA